MKKSAGPRPEHPLIFTGHSVLAVLAGTKTMTRRLIPRPKVGKRVVGCDACWNASVPHNGKDAAFGGPCYLRVPACDHVGADDYPGGGRIFPRWNVGDHLWVKEGWAAPHVCDPLMPSQMRPNTRIHYRSTWEGPSGLMWRTPMYMPRWASRITLEVTAVRAERLADISEEDARAEGVETGKLMSALINGERGKVMIFDPRKAFAVAWDAIHGKKCPFASNPWVFATSFKYLPVLKGTA